jgi:hypothetical protein
LVSSNPTVAETAAFVQRKLQESDFSSPLGGKQIQILLVAVIIAADGDINTRSTTEPSFPSD